MSSFYVAYRHSSCFRQDIFSQLKQVSTWAAVGFAVRYIYECPYPLVISYLLFADHTADFIGKRLVISGKVKKMRDWYKLELALLLLLFQVIKVADRLLNPEKKRYVVEGTLLIYLYRRVAVARQLNNAR